MTGWTQVSCARRRHIITEHTELLIAHANLNFAVGPGQKGPVSFIEWVDEEDRTTPELRDFNYGGAGCEHFVLEATGWAEPRHIRNRTSHRAAIYSPCMEFSAELREAVLAGDITVSFRLWQRPRVKTGGRYRVGPGHIVVDSVELVPFVSVSNDDVIAAGKTDREALRRRAAHAGPIADDTMLYRIEFHPVGE
ncbi:hypothetical protein GCM10027568_32130 [Humibacter soli]